MNLRQLITQVLADLTIESEGFASCQSAIKALFQRVPSFLFLDVSLAGSDAIEVIHGLKNHQFAGPVQLMSGSDIGLLDDIYRVGKRHGLRMLPPLQKPIRPQIIRDVVKQEGLVRTDASCLGSEGMGTPRASRHPDAISSDLAPGPLMSLDEAIRNNWLELWYQPKIDLRTNAIVGAEGLIRARHPLHGILAPGMFLGGATESCLIDLTEFVLRTAMRDWSGFAHQGTNLRLAVNVPVSALMQMPIPAFIRQHRPTESYWPGIMLEVTEDEVIRDVPLAHEIATQLRIYGVSLAIDDFGAGYSSLARLKELPFAELKLDRSLVANCGKDERQAGLCQAAIDLAHRFDSMAVAEGIEEMAEYTALQLMGCDIGQGYFFGRPMPRDQLLNFVQESRADRQAS